MTALIADLLRQRVRRGGAAPLLTYYDLDTGERTELSATSFLNWVDKTSNLFVDDLRLESGAVVGLELARSAPGHWLTLAIELASWQIGATVTVGQPTGAAVDVLVVGPDWQGADLTSAETVLACALHPLGLGFAQPLPASLVDFAVEVRGQSDVYLPTGGTGEELAWVDDQRRLTQDDLVRQGGALGGGTARRLVPVSDPWSSVRDGLLVTLVTGGSVVLIQGEDPDRVARIRQDERVEA